MNVTLIRYTPEPDALCGEAAAICTGYKGDPLKALRGALESGHESVAEHAGFTFRIEDVSRVLLAQLTALVFACPGVANCTVTAPAADMAIQADELPVLGTLTVEELT